MASASKPKMMMALLGAVSVLLLDLGCTGPGQTEARLQNPGTEVLSPVEHPSWYVRPPQGDGKARMIAGTGTSTVSVEEALWMAEADARNEAARIVGSLVRSEWEQKMQARIRDNVFHSQEEINYLTRILSEEPLMDAAVSKRTFREGDRIRNGKAAGHYYQGFVLLSVPEENFAFSPSRCLQKAQSFMVQGDREKALRTMEGAVLCWPADPSLLERLAVIQEGAGRLGDALQTLGRLLSMCTGEKRPAIQKEIGRLEKQYAGGEFAYLDNELRKAVTAALNSEKLTLRPLQNHAHRGGTIDYTVLSDRPYSYFGLWIDGDGIFLYPAHAESSGTRLGNDEGALLVGLDVGRTPGEHLFVLLADLQSPAWFKERSFSKDLVNRRAADSAGRFPHRELAGIIEDVRMRSTEGRLVAASISFEVIP